MFAGVDVRMDSMACDALLPSKCGSFSHSYKSNKPQIGLGLAPGGVGSLWRQEAATDSLCLHCVPVGTFLGQPVLVIFGVLQRLMINFVLFARGCFS